LPARRDRDERELLQALGVTSAALVPLVLHAEKLGVLVMGSAQRDLSDDDWIAFARALAGQLAQAVGLARSFTRVTRSERRYRSLLEQADDAIFAIDARGIVIEANRRAQEMLGRPLVELQGQPFAEWVTGEGDTAGRVRALLVEGTKLSNVRLKRPDSWQVIVDVQAALVVSGGEEVVLAIARDVSERRRLEREQARLLRKADDAVRARDEFIEAAARDLREPTVTLEHQVDGLLAAEGDDLPRESFRARLSGLRDHARSLARTVETLRDATRIHSGTLVLERSEVDLADVARTVAERLRPERARAGGQADVEAPAPVLGRWDRARLEQLVGNLIANAARMGPGSPIEVTVELSRELGCVTVADRGVGIAPDRQPELFERVKSQGRASPAGLGLGLWLVREIALAHGGRVLVATRPGRGSAFTVELPVG
jgi:PAS domain S-box-containing protein